MPRCATNRARAASKGFMLKHRDARYGVGRTKDVGDVVEMEDRSADASTRCSSTRSAATGVAQALHRLHVRRLGRTATASGAS